MPEALSKPIEPVSGDGGKSNGTSASGKYTFSLLILCWLTNINQYWAQKNKLNIGDELSNHYDELAITDIEISEIDKSKVIDQL